MCDGNRGYREGGEKEREGREGGRQVHIHGLVTDSASKMRTYKGAWRGISGGRKEIPGSVPKEAHLLSVILLFGSSIHTHVQRPFNPPPTFSQ